jgi:hypothetical protein
LPLRHSIVGGTIKIPSTNLRRTPRDLAQAIICLSGGK